MGSSARLCGRSVLVVEDEALIALGLKELFEAEGADVHIASTPQDALRLVDEIVFSAAVLDFGSAGDDKAPLCRALRAYGIAFMYYTGYDDLDEGSAGPPVVAKPASGEVLIATIAQLLNLPSQSNASARH
jgi:DNA-binding response OmpR family regulator